MCYAVLFRYLLADYQVANLLFGNQFYKAFFMPSGYVSSVLSEILPGRHLPGVYFLRDLN